MFDSQQVPCTAQDGDAFEWDDCWGPPVDPDEIAERMQSDGVPDGWLDAHRIRAPWDPLSLSVNEARERQRLRAARQQREARVRANAVHIRLSHPRRPLAARPRAARLRRSTLRPPATSDPAPGPSADSATGAEQDGITCSRPRAIGIASLAAKTATRTEGAEHIGDSRARCAQGQLLMAHRREGPRCVTTLTHLANANAAPTLGKPECFADSRTELRLRAPQSHIPSRACTRALCLVTSTNKEKPHESVANREW
jgi:hypothetical protein